LDRRSVLIGGGAGIGLIVAFNLWPRHLQSDLTAGEGEQTFGNFVKIGRDGKITVAVAQTETGQGIWTALPQVVADELGAAWETIAVEPAPLTPAYRNPLAEAQGWPKNLRITAGSTSVRAFEGPLRHAAAVARDMLIGAAADRWNISPAECDVADGFIINGGRTFTFGELAEEAADRSPPANPPLRNSSKGRLIGQPLQRLDAPAKADGSWRYAGDVRLPGMLFAAARIAPPGGRLRSFSREKIGSIPGVRHVAARDGWVAVVARSWWEAERALKAAKPLFSGLRSASDMRTTFDDALANGDGERWAEIGDYDGATRGSRPLAATYYVAPSQHLALEPLTATARFNGSTLEVWAPAQAPEAARSRAEEAAPGIPVLFYPMPCGEPAGRALEADAVPIAVALAKSTNAPVQVSLSQSSSQSHDRLSGGMLARLMALPGASGITAAWKMRLATADGFGAALAALQGQVRSAKLAAPALDGSVPTYSIPNVSVEAVPTAVPFEAGYMRGSPQRELSFFIESFVDELAHAAGMEPLAFRMSMLGQNGRLARCLQGAARLAQWDGGAPGSTMGIAGCSAYGSHIGLVASASIGDDQRVKVHRLVAAVDCGRVMNSGLVTQQIESGLVWALAQSTVAEPEWVAGLPRARRLGDIGLSRIVDVPEIVIEIIPSSDPPGGISGLGTTVLAPALANAIYAGSGKRIRSLPFDLMATA
jgi:isoquinoline 1-oxidoreductase beta subunit